MIYVLNVYPYMYPHPSGLPHGHQTQPRHTCVNVLPDSIGTINITSKSTKYRLYENLIITNKYKSYCFFGCLRLHIHWIQFLETVDSQINYTGCLTSKLHYHQTDFLIGGRTLTMMHQNIDKFLSILLLFLWHDCIYLATLSKHVIGTNILRKTDKTNQYESP